MTSATRLDRGLHSARRSTDASVLLQDGTPPPEPGDVAVPACFLALRRRVVFVNRFYFPDISATSQVLTGLAQRLAADGVEVHVICCRHRYEGEGDALAAAETIDRVHVHRVATTNFGRGSLAGRALDYATFYPSAAWALRRILRPGDIVVAKTDPPLLAVAIAPIARMRRAHLVNWLQDLFPEIAGSVRPGPLARLLLRPLSYLRDRTLRRARMNVVLGPGMQEYLRGRAVPEAQLRIVQNWAVGEPVRPIPPWESELRATLDLRERYVVGYSGNLGHAHDHETILAAAELLRDDDGIVFLMIGGGSGMRLLRQRAEAAGLGNFRFVPYQPRERLADSLAASDVHLVTLRPSAESFVMPSKLYGIMAAQRPVVFVGDAGGEVARVIERADCGVNVPAGDGARLAAELQQLRGSAGLRQRLAMNGAAAYRADYTFDAAFGRWVDLLQDVVS